MVKLLIVCSIAFLTGEEIMTSVYQDGSSGSISSGTHNSPSPDKPLAKLIAIADSKGNEKRKMDLIVKQTNLYLKKVRDSDAFFILHEAYDRYWPNMDSLFDFEMTNLFNSMIEKHKKEKQMHEIEMGQLEKTSKVQKIKEQNQTIENQRYLIIFFSLLVLLVVLVVLFSSKNRQLMRTKKTLSKVSDQQNYLQGIIAHDLKNNLLNIYSLIEVFKQNTSNLEQGQIAYLSAMQTNVKRLNISINNIINLDKLKNRLRNYQIEEVSLSRILNELTESYEFIAIQKGITFNKKVNQSCRAHTDGQCMSEIFDNLLSNALRYSPENSAIKIKLLEENGEVLFSIFNHTDGMKKGNTGSLKIQTQSSTGLGLSIVSQYLEALSGQFTVSESKGFLFQFRIPKY